MQLKRNPNATSITSSVRSACPYSVFTFVSVSVFLSMSVSVVLLVHVRVSLVRVLVRLRLRAFVVQVLFVFVQSRLRAVRLVVPVLVVPVLVVPVLVVPVLLRLVPIRIVSCLSVSSRAYPYRAGLSPIDWPACVLTRRRLVLGSLTCCCRVCVPVGASTRFRVFAFRLGA